MLSLADIPTMCCLKAKWSSVGYSLFPLRLSFKPRSSCLLADLTPTWLPGSWGGGGGDGGGEGVGVEEGGNFIFLPSVGFLVITQKWQKL